MTTTRKQYGPKFISANRKTAWLCYSANFTRDRKANPPVSQYAMVLQEIRLATDGAK